MSHDPTIEIEREPVTSSNITSVGYSAEHEALDVEFNTGAVYRYQGVPQSAYDQLRESESVGRFVYARINGHYPCSRI